MKTKKLKIRFQSIDETLDQFENDWKDIKNGMNPFRVIASNDFVLMMDYERFSKLFSTQRLRLIHMIQAKQPTSINQLAKFLKREQANVHRDVQFLSDLGILELKRNKTHGKHEVVRPEFNWSSIEIEIGNKKEIKKEAA